MSLVDGIKSLCSKNGVTITRLEKDAGLGRGTIVRWDTNSPSIDKVMKVADYFNVPVSALVDDQKEKPTVESGELDPVTREIVEIVEAASDEERRMILNIIKEILRKRDTN